MNRQPTGPPFPRAAQGPYVPSGLLALWLVSHWRIEMGRSSHPALRRWEQGCFGTAPVGPGTERRPFRTLLPPRCRGLRDCVPVGSGGPTLQSIPIRLSFS